MNISASAFLSVFQAIAIRSRFHVFNFMLLDFSFARLVPPLLFIFWQRLDSIHLSCAVTRPKGFGYHTRTLPQKGETGDPILNFLSSHFVCSPTHPTRNVCFFVSFFEPRHLTYELGTRRESLITCGTEPHSASSSQDFGLCIQ